MNKTARWLISNRDSVGTVLSRWSKDKGKIVRAHTRATIEATGEEVSLDADESAKYLAWHEAGARPQMIEQFS